MSEICKIREYDDLQAGDLVALDQISNTVHKANQKDKKEVVGVCVETYPETNEALICNEGMVDVNVIGIICLGDHLRLSHVNGKADAINTIQEEDIFGVRSIGKVVGLYDIYSKAKVLLNIK